MNVSIDDYVNYHDGIIETPEAEFYNYRGVGDALHQSMLKNANRIAQIDADTGENDSFSSLLKRSIRTALEMRARGVTPKDVISICTHNHLNTCVPFIAAQFLGAKVASLDPSLSVSATTHLIKQVSPKMIFVSPEAVSVIEESIHQAKVFGCEIVEFGTTKKHSEFCSFLHEWDEENEFVPNYINNLSEPAVILFSSGTTGLPKGICISHRSLLCKSPFAEVPVILAYTSFYWISAVLWFAFSCFGGNARVIAKSFDPYLAWNYIEKYKVTLFFAAPVLAVEFYKASRKNTTDTNSLQLFIISGSSVSPIFIQELRNLLPTTFVAQLYGQTEVGLVAYFSYKKEKDMILSLQKPASCGRPARGLSYKIVDTTTEKVLGFNQKGELRVKGNHLMVGYYNLDSSSAWDSDGWLKTGDIVYYDEDFCFYIVDRIKEMLKYRSWHVAPAVIENIIATHPAVKECVVFGVPHEEDGDHPAALVVLDTNTSSNIFPKDIEEYVKQRVDDRHQLRGGVQFVQHLLYTPTGKVKRNNVRDLFTNCQLHLLT